ncbi:hypothetical protein IWW36_005185, partial [Coemansia brasiliensis]
MCPALSLDQSYLRNTLLKIEGSFVFIYKNDSDAADGYDEAVFIKDIAKSDDVCDYLEDNLDEKYPNFSHIELEKADDRDDD